MSNTNIVQAYILRKKFPKITDLQSRMVEAIYQAEGDLKRAAELIGCELQTIYQFWLCDGDFDQIFLWYGRKMLQCNVPKALKRVVDATEPDAKPNKVQLEACRMVLDRAGFAVPSGKEDKSQRNQKDITEMTRAELQLRIAEIERSMPDVTPGASAMSPQLIDMLSD